MEFEYAPEKNTAENSISSEEFDRKFDAGEDVSKYIDWSKALSDLRAVRWEARKNPAPVHMVRGVGGAATQ